MWQESRVHLALPVRLINPTAQLNKKMSLVWKPLHKRILYLGQKINLKNQTYFLHNKKMHQTYFLDHLIIHQGFSISTNHRNNLSLQKRLKKRRNLKKMGLMSKNNNLNLSNNLQIHYLISSLNKKSYQNQFFLWSPNIQDSKANHYHKQ